MSVVALVVSVVVVVVVVVDAVVVAYETMEHDLIFGTLLMRLLHPLTLDHCYRQYQQ